MKIFISLIIVTSFSISAVLETLVVIARIAASLEGKNALGSSLERMLSTIKRLFIFFYPPFVGLLIVKDEIDLLFKLIIVSYVTSFFLVVVSYYYRNSLILFFRKVVSIMLSGRGMLDIYRRIISGIFLDSKEKMDSNTSLNIPRIKKNNILSFRVVAAYSWIFFLYSSVIFILNIVSYLYKEYSAIILQLNGFLNGLATIIMAFYGDPIISILLDKGKNLEGILNTIVFAQIISYLLVGPFLFFVIYITFFV